MNPDELKVDARERVDRWIGESRDLLGHAIPGILQDRQRQWTRAEMAERACEQLELEANDLRRELGGLHSEVRTLKIDLVEIGYAASALASHLNRAIVPLTELRHTLPDPAEAPPAPAVEVEPAAGVRGIPWKTIALVIAAAIGAAILTLGVAMLAPIPPAPPAPAPPPHAAPAVPAPPLSPHETGAVIAPEPPRPASALGAPAPRRAARAASPEPIVPSKTTPSPEAPPGPESLAAAPRNEIRNFRAVEVSGQVLQVTVDYAYVGDYGTSEIFIHAVALERDEWQARVPGTGFPYSAIAVGGGTVTIAISRQPDTPPATSTLVKVCMVSITKRAAFMCETFPYTKTWES